MTDKIIIYTNETCPYCKEVKEHLTSKDIKFEERLTKDWTSEYNKVVSTTNLPAVPTVIYKNSYFVPGRDFHNPGHLIEIIERFEPSNVSIEKQLLERVNTLNYNISMAFGRTDQILRQMQIELKNIKNDKEEK